MIYKWHYRYLSAASAHTVLQIVYVFVPGPNPTLLRKLFCIIHKMVKIIFSFIFTRTDLVFKRLPFGPQWCIVEKTGAQEVPGVSALFLHEVQERQGTFHTEKSTQKAEDFGWSSNHRLIWIFAVRVYGKHVSWSITIIKSVSLLNYLSYAVLWDTL